MSANAYEIRQGLLGQAQDILREKFTREWEQTRYLCDRDLVNPKTVTWPSPPSTQEIITEAERLYKFVQQK